MTVNGVQVAKVLANGYRADLEEAGLGSGRHAFKVRLGNSSPLGPCTLRVCREDDDTDIPGSPTALSAVGEFDAGVQDSLAQFLGDYASDDDLKIRLKFLAQQTERLLQLRADRQSHRFDREARGQLKWRWSSGSREEMQSNAITPRALVIGDVTPVQGRDAGSNAITSHMQSLQRLGYEVSFAPADMAYSEGLEQLERIDVLSYCRPWSGAVEEVIQRQVDCFDLIYIHRLSNMCYMPFINRFQRRSRTLFSVADLSSLRLARQAAVEERPELVQYSRRIGFAEIAASRSVDMVLTHSSHEAALLRAQLNPESVKVVPWSIPVRPTEVPFRSRNGLAFIGDYAHAPNVDAVYYLIQDIMPLVWQQNANLTCILVGSNMPHGFSDIQEARIIIAGHIPNLVSLFGKVRLTVAPLTFGAGVKGKVLDSLSAGVPCVCTPVAAEGLDLPALLLDHVISAPADFAAAILRLHNDEDLNAAVSKAGLDFITSQYQDKNVDAALEACLGRPSS